MRLPESWIVPESLEKRRVWALGTFVAAVAFRAVLFVSGLVDVMFTTGDSPEYKALGRSLLEHHVFGIDGVPKMNRTPGYPAFLAVLFATVGGSQFAITAAQVALDAVVCAMMVDLALRARLSRLGVLVSSVLAVTCVFTAALTYSVMTETLYTFFLTLAVWVMPDGGITAVARRTDRWRLVVAGLSVGVATLIRPVSAVSIVAFPAFVAFLLWRAVRRRAFSPRPLVAAVVFGAAASAVVVPWMVRNRTVFHEEYEKADHSHVTLLGFKTDVPVYRHWYSPEFMHFRRSYEEPFVMEWPYRAPVVVKYAYPGEKTDVAAAFEHIEKDIKANDDPIPPEHLAPFAAIGDKRYAALPRLYVTAPITRVIKLWIVPRASLLLAHHHGGNIGTKLLVGLTLYNCIYVLPGLFGLMIGLRRVKSARASILALLLAQTLLYALWHSAPQSRYLIPMFPMLALGCGAAVDAVALRGRALLPRWLQRKQGISPRAARA